MRNTLLVGIGLALITVALYWPVGEFEFTNYDDPQYVSDNVKVLGGLTRDGVKWAFGPNHWAWHPLSFVSHMIDVELYGERPGGHHMTNVVIHAINAMLLLVVLSRFTGAIWRSALVAALFALHPLRVESVAWVTERKDVLFMLFGLLAMWSYTAYAKHGGWFRYSGVFVFMALSLMSKAMFVTLPFVLMLLDFWPLRRMRNQIGSAGLQFYPRRPLRSLVIEKILLLLLSVSCCAMMLWVATEVRAVASTEGLAIGPRIANAFVSYMHYIRDLFWPKNLAVLYPHPVRWDTSIVSIGVLTFVSITGLVITQCRRRPYLIIGWFIYLGTLVPVIGLVQAGDQARADRFTYLPMIGLYIMVAWLLGEIVSTSTLRKTMATTTAVAVLLALSVLTHRQLKVWRNPVTLWEHTIAVTDKNPVSYFNLAGAYNTVERHEDAIRYYQMVLNIKPRWVDARYILGSILRRDEKNIPEVVKLYEQTLEFDPHAHEVLNALGLIRRDYQGRESDGIELIERSVEVKPDYQEALYNLGTIRIQQQRNEEAVTLLNRALQQSPDDVEILVALGHVLPRLGQFEEARIRLERALEQAPDHSKANANMAAVLAGTGRIDDAIHYFLKRIAIGPESSEIHQRLAQLFEKQNRMNEAIEQYRKALMIDPENALAREAAKRLGISRGLDR